MLILSRKAGEEICIGDEIRILVHQINGGAVRIGVHAPKDVPVHRREVYEKIKEEEIARWNRSTS